MKNPERFSIEAASILDEACDLLDKGIAYSIAGAVDASGRECDPWSEEAVAWDGLGALYGASHNMSNIFPNLGRLKRVHDLANEGAWFSYHRNRFAQVFRFEVSQGRGPQMVEAMRAWAQEVFDAHNG